MTLGSSFRLSGPWFLLYNLKVWAKTISNDPFSSKILIFNFSSDISHDREVLHAFFDPNIRLQVTQLKKSFCRVQVSPSWDQKGLFGDRHLCPQINYKFIIDACMEIMVEWHGLKKSDLGIRRWIFWPITLLAVWLWGKYWISLCSRISAIKWRALRS